MILQLWLGRLINICQCFLISSSMTIFKNWSWGLVELFEWWFWSLFARWGFVFLRFTRSTSHRWCSCTTNSSAFCTVVLAFLNKSKEVFVCSRLSRLNWVNRFDWSTWFSWFAWFDWFYRFPWFLRLNRMSSTITKLSHKLIIKYITVIVWLSILSHFSSWCPIGFSIKISS